MQYKDSSWSRFKNWLKQSNATCLIPSTLVSVNSSSASSWILDTGAMDHIISHKSLLIEPKSSNITSVNLPNGATTQVRHTSTVIFNPKLTLKNVPCVPSFNLNLVSTNKLTKDLNCCILLFSKFSILQDLVSGKMIGLCRQCGGLYYMHPSKNKSTIFHVT